MVGGSGGGGGGIGSPTNPPTPKSPARRQCEQKAQQQYSQAQATALNKALLVALEGGAVTSGALGIGGCLVGSGIGAGIGALLGGVGSFGTVPVGCITGGISAALDGLPVSVVAGTISALITYDLDVRAAQNNYQQAMQACSVIP